MSYDRVLHRNSLLDNYGSGPDQTRSLIAGDLRRLEVDQQDDRHIAAYAKLSGISQSRVRRLLALFFATDTSELGRTVAEALREKP